MPVGRTICSTTRAGVRALVLARASRETNTICGVIDRNSSNVCGRLSSALGSRKP